jgi:8-oxo-dGTP pyrophosphatase MutT (NUDIX family)
VTGIRHVARAVLLDQAGRVLLLRVRHPDGRPFWALPGGAVEGAESHAEAAMRELREELDIARVEPGPCVWTRDHRFPVDGRDVRWVERHLLVHIDDPVTLPANARWWSAEELASSNAQLRPVELPDLVAGLLRDGPPATPIACSS